MLAVADYNMRTISVTDIPAKTLFAAPSPKGNVKTNTFADLVNRCGRVSVVLIPLTDLAWTRYSMHCRARPDSSRGVTKPHSHAFQDAIELWMEPLIQAVLKEQTCSPASLEKVPRALEELGVACEDPFPNVSCGNANDVISPSAGWTTVVAESRMLISEAPQRTQQGSAPPFFWTPLWLRLRAAALSEGNRQSEDLWGPSRWMLTDCAANAATISWGITIAMKRSQLQTAAATVYQNFQEQINNFSTKGRFPVNWKIEIRASALDQNISKIPGTSTVSFPLSPLYYDPIRDYECALVMDVVSLKGTRDFPVFCVALLGSLREQLTDMRVLSDWSKFPFVDSTHSSVERAELAVLHKSLPWTVARDQLDLLDAKRVFVSCSTTRALPPDTEDN
jgi:hypothetical protein